MQHSSYSEFLVRLLKSSMNGKHKFVTHQRLVKHVLQTSGSLAGEAVKALTTDFKLWESVFKTEDYTDVITKLIPGGSALLILQFSNDKR